MRNWVPENQLLNKFAGFPFIAIDDYGRERHPEWTNSEAGDIEDYAHRRDRMELMMKTMSYVPDGIPPATRIILLDVDHLNMTERTGATNGTVVNSMMGGHYQPGMLIDLSGRFIQILGPQNIAREDEVLSNIFGVPVGGL